MSPVQKLQSRRTRTLLPTRNELLQPKVAANVQSDIEYRRQKAKAYYDKGAHSLPALQIGDTVRMQPLDRTGSWSKVSVVKKVAERSYLVKTDQGHLLRRNRRFLRSKRELQDVSPKGMTIPEMPAMELHRPELLKEPLTTEVQSSQADKSTQQEEMSSADKVEQQAAEQMEVPTAESPAQVTRAGRAIKTPAKFKDFVKL